VYNYADDNSLSITHNDIYVLKNVLEQSSLQAISWFKSNQVMLLHRSPQTVSITLNIGNSAIIPCECIKLLGVYIDQNLSFDDHVTHLCKKAAKQINALSRISRNLNIACKMKIINAYIFSNFTFCSLIYHFSSKKNERKLEKLQERALRAAFNDYVCQYSDLLEKAKLQRLCVKRCKRVIEHVFKAIHDLSPLFSNDFYTVKESNYYLRHSKLLKIPNFNTVRYGQNSLKYQASKLWNLLPCTLVDIDDHNSFKAFLESCDLNVM
jgi:hypothetical protein